MNNHLRTTVLLAVITSVLFILFNSSCGGEQCIESFYCCNYTCVTEQEIKERGPDVCACREGPGAAQPEGSCMAVDGKCDWH